MPDVERSRAPGASFGEAGSRGSHNVVRRVLVLVKDNPAGELARTPDDSLGHGQVLGMLGKVSL